MKTNLRLLALVPGVCVLAALGCQPYPVEPTVETEPVLSSGDAADDPAVWIHPSEPASSTVIGTDKQAGLGVYDLAGQRIQNIERGKPNNVDLRYDFPLDGGSVDLVATSDREFDEVSLFAVDGTTGLLDPSPIGQIPLGYEPYGLCMFVSPTTGTYYVFVNNKSGEHEQWELADLGGGVVGGTLVRSFAVATQPEACVADDENALLFVGEEAVGIWRYGAEPGDGDDRTKVDSAEGNGYLAADVEGLALYHTSDGGGYLLASSQGASRFEVYARNEPHGWLGRFEIVATDEVDAVQKSDGIDVVNVDLGPAFPLGLFVAQDDVSEGGNQNFKLVPWDAIAVAWPEPLDVDTGWNPRD